MQEASQSSSVPLVKQVDVDASFAKAKRGRLGHNKAFVLGVQTANRDTSIFLSETPS